jgi:LytS/YehU family sensor histidine kinase
MDVPEELYSAQVPSLILQPMVENAVKHGIAKRVQGGAIRVSALRSNGTLTLSVYNDGPKLPENLDMSGSGIGILNVRARLRSLYGDGFELNMQNQEPGRRAGFGFGAVCHRSCGEGMNCASGTKPRTNTRAGSG